MLTIRAMLPMTIAAMASTVVIFNPSAKSAEIFDADHKACIDAKDYQGCVNARSGKGQQTNINIDRTNRPGIAREVGNDCSKSGAYVGGGLCRVVYCTMATGRNHPLIAGKTHSCAGLRNGFGRPSLALGRGFRATNNPNCPQAEPALGYSSSCEKTMGGTMQGLPQNQPKSSESAELTACEAALARKVGGNGVLSAVARTLACVESLDDSTQTQTAQTMR